MIQRINYRTFSEAYKNPKCIWHLLFFLLSTSFTSYAHGCEPPAFIAPLAFARVDSTASDIVWTAVNGATGYEIELVSRIPEGEVLHRVKTIVNQTVYKPSTALDRKDATVSATVSTVCDGKLSTPVERIFSVFFSGRCPKIEDFQTIHSLGFLQIKSTSLGVSNLEFESMVFHGDEAAPGAMSVSKNGMLLLATPISGKWVAGLRRRCNTTGTAFSEWSWIAREGSD